MRVIAHPLAKARNAARPKATILRRGGATLKQRGQTRNAMPSIWPKAVQGGPLRGIGSPTSNWNAVASTVDTMSIMQPCNWIMKVRRPSA